MEAHLADNGKYGPSPESSAVGETRKDTSVLESYRMRLPRRNRKKAENLCWGLSLPSWLFLFFALFQVVSVTGLQVSIALLGDFYRDHIDAYVGCLERSIETQIEQQLNNQQNLPEVLNSTVTNFTIPNNSTYPSFGRDKAIYIFFFIALVIYNFFLCLYAIKFQNIVEIYMFMVINLLTVCYSGVQVFQFRGFGIDCEPITVVGYFALANALLVLVLTVIFLLLSLFIYVEFGWKSYKLLDCDPAMRYYYRVYQLFMSVVKLLILFLVMFLIGQCVLLLLPEDPEFGLTILFIVGAIFIGYPTVYLTVTYEFLLGYIGVFACGFLLLAYFGYKVYRYITRSCPQCQIQVAELEDARMEIISQINDQINTTLHDQLPDGSNFNETVSSVTDGIRLDFLTRTESFEHLVMLGVICLIITLVALALFLRYSCLYGRGLANYFNSQPLQQWLNKHFCCFRWCNRKKLKDGDFTDGNLNGGQQKVLQLKKKRQRKGTTGSTNDERRESGLHETFSDRNVEFEPHM